jgi:galactokinase
MRHHQNALELSHVFERRFGSLPRLFRAPGRVNIIGEHTDYNDGFVLPAALDLATFVAIAPRSDRVIRAYSANLDAQFEFDMDGAHQPRGDWSDYIRGVVLEIEKSAESSGGADIAILGALPMGSGLSASAALEVALGYGLLSVAHARIDLLDLAKICQRAENNFVGMRCGIMDQFISCHGVEGRALLLDCRSREARPVRIDPAVRLVVCNTMVHHKLAGSEYNLRRQDCEMATALLAAKIEGVAALRDVDAAQLERYAASLPEQIARRARHVITENERTVAAANALDAGDFEVCGRYMYASHASLRDDYEVSCPELDLMVELARGLAGVHGSRMTGGGFGGCTVSLVDAAEAAHFAEAVGPAYEKETGLKPMIFSCFSGPGAGPVTF